MATGTGRLKDIGLPPLNELPIQFGAWFQIFIEKFARVDVISAEVAASAVSANTTEEQAFELLTIETTDIVYPIKPTHQAGLGIINCRVSNTDEISLTFMNTTGSGITPTTEDYKFLITRMGN